MFRCTYAFITHTLHKSTYTSAKTFYNDCRICYKTNPLPIAR
ncbi:hypothetical protein Hanom_Chr02g00155691 [Helianthus anomalus]